MVSSLKFAPSILAADFTRLGEQVKDAAAARASQIHIDVMDGRFVDMITMGPIVADAVNRATSLPLDVHLMIVEPDHLLKAFRDAGADAITVHWEACPNLHRTLGTIKSLGARAGVAINPATPVDLLVDVMSLVDIVLVMTVNPGYGGQAFIPSTLAKIRRVRELVSGSDRDIDISVDGGINRSTLVDVRTAGANVFVVGSAVFNHEATVQANLDGLRALVAENK
ncbi:MAG: ribulose-phosphate 3-epimerase [Anaerolineae bacterium]